MNAVTVELHKRVLVSNRGEIAIRIAKAGRTRYGIGGRLRER